MNEMRKLKEALDRIDEEVTPIEFLKELRSELFALSNRAAQIQYLYSEMPGTEEYSRVAKEVEVECDRLRKLIHSKL